MATIGKLNKQNVITEIIKTSDDHSDGNFGLTWAKKSLGGTWILCSIGDRQPAKNIVPGIGFYFDKEQDVFIPPKPYESWILNKDSWIWEAPVPVPNETEEDLKTVWSWDEKALHWQKNSDTIVE